MYILYTGFQVIRIFSCRAIQLVRYGYRYTGLASILELCWYSWRWVYTYWVQRYKNI